MGGVDEEVDEYLPEAGFVRFDARDFPVIFDESRSVADLVECHVDGQLQQRDHLDDGTLFLLSTGECLEPSDDLSNPFGSGLSV